MDSKYYLNLPKELVAKEKERGFYNHSCYFLPDLGVYALKKTKTVRASNFVVFIISGTCAIYDNFKTVAGTITIDYFPKNVQYLYHSMSVDCIKRNNLLHVLPKSLCNIVNCYLV